MHIAVLEILTTQRNSMSNTIQRLTISFALAFLATACMTSAPERKSTLTAKTFVSGINLSQTVGSVGEPFVSELALFQRRSGEVEIQVRSLPPGLHFEKSKMSIVGVPKADGFFSVTIAVRKKRGSGIHFDTPEGAWFSERLDIDIYRPIQDEVEGIAMNDTSDY